MSWKTRCEIRRDRDFGIIPVFCKILGTGMYPMVYIVKKGDYPEDSNSHPNEIRNHVVNLSKG